MTPQAATLIARRFHHADGELCIGNAPVSTLAARHGTPLFVYDRGIIDQQLLRLRQALPAEFLVYYSVKANPNRAILQHLLTQGCGFEIASAGEFYQAFKAGCPPQNILFAGPGKTEAELETVLAHGIGEIHVESLLEIERLQAISRGLGERARIAVRVNPSTEAQGGAMRMGGKPAPFGIDEEGLTAAMEKILSCSALEFRGIHLFSGTQILDHAVLLQQYRHGVTIAKRVATRFQQPLATLDFGGGFGIPYFPHERELNLTGLRDGLVTLMAEIKQETFLAGARCLIEPGRFVVGEAGVYLARVNDIKTSRGKKFLILDGGMNHHLAASGNLGQVIKRNFPIVIVNKIDAPIAETVDIVGPLCTPLDTLARDIEVPITEVGDLVGILQSGAYARAASPLQFLGRPSPPEVWVDGDNVELIRARGCDTDEL